MGIDGITAVVQVDWRMGDKSSLHMYLVYHRYKEHRRGSLINVLNAYRTVPFSITFYSNSYAYNKRGKCMRRTVLQVVLVQHSFVLKGWETFEVPPDDGLP